MRVEQIIEGAAELALACESRFKAQDDRLRDLQQAMESQATELVSELQYERAHGARLSEQFSQVTARMEDLESKTHAQAARIEGLETKLHTQMADTERLKEELADKRRSEAELRQELRALEETTSRALSKAEEERRTLERGLQEQLHAQSERISATDRASKAESESVRLEVNKQATSRQAENAGMREEHTAAMHKLSDSLRQMDEDHTRRRVEDERKLATSLESLRGEFTTSLTAHRDQTQAKFDTQAADTERLKEELADKRRSEAELRQELRALEETTSRALSKAEEERRTLERGLQEQLHAQSERISATDRASKAESESIRLEVNKQATSRQAEIAAIKELIAETSRVAKSDAESIRSELSKLAASSEAESAALRELIRRSDRSAKEESESIRLELKKHATEHATGITAVKELVSATERGAKAESESIRSKLAKHAEMIEAELSAIKELAATTARTAEADVEAIRSELTKQTASFEVAVTAIREDHAARMQGLDDGLRSWATEAISRSSTEDERKTAASIEGVRKAFATRLDELSTKHDELRGQIAEAAKKPSESSAEESRTMSTLREALYRMDALGRVVARLSDQVEQYGCAAEARNLIADYLWRPGVYIPPARPRSPIRASSPPPRVWGQHRV